MSRSSFIPPPLPSLIKAHWHWLGWMVLLPVCLHFRGLWLYCTALLALLILNECVVRVASGVTGIRKPILLLALWSAWIITLYVNIAWRASPNSQFGSNLNASFSSVPHSYYDELTRSLLQGRLDLGITPSPELTALPDPYPPEVREHGMYLYDASYYKGKYYAYFGISPVLALLLPFYALTGLFFPGSLATALFCSLGYLFSLLCLLDIWQINIKESNMFQPRHHTPHGGPLHSSSSAIITALLLGIGNFVPFMLRKPFIYETAIAAGYCFAMAGAFALARAWIRRENQQRCCIWLFCAGLSLALAVGSRPPLITLGILSVIFFFALFRARLLSQPRLLSFLIPYGTYGLLLAVYNFLRFNSWIEFGRHYQLSDENHIQGNLCLDDLPTLIAHYLTLPPKLLNMFPYVVFRWEWHLPFCSRIDIESPIIGILCLLPMALLVLMLFIPHRRITGSFSRNFLWGLLVCFLLMLLTDASVGQADRYLIDMLPYLLLPMLMVCFTSITRLNGWTRNLFSLLFTSSAVWCSFLVFFPSCDAVNDAQLDETISHYRKTLDLHPDDPLFHDYLGLFLSQKGDLEAATDQYLKTVAIDPSNAEAQNNIGTGLWGNGLHAMAIERFSKAVKLQPNYFDAQNNLGSALLQSGEVDESIPHLLKALQINPDSAESHYNMGNALLQEGHRDEALSQFRTALLIYPGYSDAHNLLGSLLFQEGKSAAAIREFEKAVEEAPMNASYASNLAWVLATCPQRSLRNGGRAVAMAERANQINGSSRPLNLRTLAASYAEAGRFPEAVETAAHALKLAELQGDVPTAAALRQELRLYLNKSALP